MTTPKRSPGAHDICIHPNDMHRHTCHSQTSEIDSADAAARGDSRPTGMHVLIHVSTQCFCSYVLMWETNTCGNLSKAVIGGTATLKVLVLPCPCLHQELLITCLPQHREWDTGRARTRRQHEELSPANNFDMLPCCRFRNVAPRASRRCAEPPRVWYTEGHNDKTAHNAVTSRQVQLDRSTHARKRAGGSLWHCTPHSRQLLQSVLIRFYPWKCSRDFAISLGSFLTWCDLGDFDSPAISVALSKALSRLAETQGN